MADDKTYTKAELDAAIEAATTKFQESIDRLETKNAEIVADLRKARKGAEIKPEDLQAAEDRADKAETALKEAQKAAKDATSAKEKAEKALQAEQGFTQKLLIQDGLKSALIANGVKDEDFIDSLAAKFGATASIVIDGDQRKAMLGDKPMADAIKEWAGSEAGKKFVEAPANSGGGAGGGDRSKGGGNVKTMTRSAYDSMPQEDRASLMPQMVKGELKIVDEAA
jgi:ATP:corrinoid adenosyltransferase